MQVCVAFVDVAFPIPFRCVESSPFVTPTTPDNRRAISGDERDDEDDHYTSGTKRQKQKPKKKKTNRRVVRDAGRLEECTGEVVQWWRKDSVLLCFDCIHHYVSAQFVPLVSSRSPFVVPLRST